MEESAQRRERLKAMRMEASQDSATYNDGSEHSAVSLSNPLLESTANPEGQVQPLAQSFNYYTNPMAAFSGNKQKTKVSPQISQDYSSTPPTGSRMEMFPSPSFHPPINHSPNQRMQQPQGQYGNSNYGYASNAPQGGNFQGRNWNTNSPRPGGYHGGPGGVGFPSPGPQFNPSSSHVSGQGGYTSPQTHFNSGPSRGSAQGGYASPQTHFSSGPGRGSGQGGYGSPQTHFSGGPGRGSVQGGYPSPGPRFRNSPNHGSGQGRYPGSGSNQGRGHWLGNSMGSSPSSGRGRGQWSGRGRGGGHSHVSAEDRPDLFYNKSMVEDPWKFLEPVIWKSHKKPSYSHSLGTKKARVSESPRYQQQSSSQPSLAEILAASFNETATDEPNTD